MGYFDEQRAARAELTGAAHPAVVSGLAKQAVARTCDYLLSHQHPAGYWSSPVEGESTFDADYVLLQSWLGREREPSVLMTADGLLDRQLADGGWSLYPDGDVDLDASVRSYLALKLAGQSVDGEPLSRARRAILRLGGADRVNGLTRYFLALMGQIDYSHCTALPPEFVWLPDWFPLSPYRISAAARIQLMPLSIVWARRPHRTVPQSQGIRELFIAGRPGTAMSFHANHLVGRTWARRGFQWLDRLVKSCEASHLCWLRSRAVRRVTDWIVDRFVGSDGLGANFGGILWSWVALKSQGFADETPELRYCAEQLDMLRTTSGGASHLQPARTPVWETAHVLDVLATAGVATNQLHLERAVDWLLEKEVTRRGDWSAWTSVEVSGWFREQYNEYYPGVESTVSVLEALAHQFGRVSKSADDVETVQVGGRARWMRRLGQRLGVFRSQEVEPLTVLSYGRLAGTAEARRFVDRLHEVASACQRGHRWLVAMQNPDGGWGSRDRSYSPGWLDAFALADSVPMRASSAAGTTGLVLSALSEFDWDLKNVTIERAVEYLQARQTLAGAWSDGTPGDGVMVTSQVIRGLRAAGLAASSHAARSGADWLLARQHPGGGWTSLDEGVMDVGHARPTPTETAWAVLALIGVIGRWHPAVLRGVQWLVEQQRSDGTWFESQYTGVDEPGGRRRKYGFYPVCYPLLALGTWRSQ